MVDPFSELSGGINCELKHHSSVREIESYLEGAGHSIDDFKVFTTVRNPWDRVVSIYHYGLKNPRSVWNAPAHAAGSFGAFVHSEVLSARFRPEPGQPPVARGTFDIDTFCRTRDGRMVATVFKVEELHTLPVWLNETFGIECALVHINETERRVYREYYTEDSRKRVSWLFESDIKMFEYEF